MTELPTSLFAIWRSEMKRPGRLFGHFDGIENGVIRGWATRKQFMGAYTEIQVCIFSEGNVIAYTRANIYRADLAKAGYDHGRFGFRVKLPSSVLSGGPHKLLIGDSDGRGLTDGNVVLLDGRLCADASSVVSLDAFLQSHARYQYKALDTGIREAIVINKELGAFAASAFLYACLLGRMPELEVSKQLADAALDDLGIKEFAHKLFYSDEAVRRRAI